MTFPQNFALALPEAILAVSALVLLVWGAFQGKASLAFVTASAAALMGKFRGQQVVDHRRNDCSR